MRYKFKVAESAAELEAVWRLNHRVYAEELAQHARQPDGLLRDRFSGHSRYWIALYGTEVVGLLAVHDQPPFSIEQRLPPPAVLDSMDGCKLEVRLLAIDPAHRAGMVIGGLFGRMILGAHVEGYEVLLISGIVNQAAMYRRIGFRDLGPPVAEGAVAFIPMVLRIGDLAPGIRRGLERWKVRAPAGNPAI